MCAKGAEQLLLEGLGDSSKLFPLKSVVEVVQNVGRVSLGKNSVALATDWGVRNWE